jgi:hypothetical protein
MERGSRQTSGFRPRAALAVGITGHRRERLAAAGAEDSYVCETIDQLLGGIAKSCRESKEQYAEFFADAEPELRLVSALAEGSDQMAAEVARGQGWVLDVCLPFSRREYTRDFSDDSSRARYQELLKEARCVFELHGSRKDEQAAYQAVGRMVLDQCDLLIAVWDGNPARGRGGTAQVVAEAIGQRIPVIRIDASARSQPELLWSGLEDADLEQLLPETVPSGPAAPLLKNLVLALSAPPPDEVDVEFLRRFLAGAYRPRRPAMSYPLLLWATGVRPMRLSDFRHRQEAGSAQDLRDLLGAVSASPHVDSERLQRLIHRYARADAAALDYSRLHRSGFVANFALAAFAVLLALAGLVLPQLKVLLVAAELLVVVSILIRTRAGNRAGWHAMWLDNRHLAERLRALCLTSLVGDLGLRDSEQRDAAAIPGWVGWYSRAVGREAGLLCRRADRGYLEQVQSIALSAVEGQIRYQETSAAQAQAVEERLERAGEIFFGTTIAACTVWLVLTIAGVQMHISGKVSATEILTLLTGFLPALGAASYGIRMQADFAGIAARAAVTSDRLVRLARAIRRDPPSQERLSARLRRLADIMLADVERWRVTYKVRQLRLPG